MRTSYWYADRPSRPAPAPPPAVPTEVDVAVVGGGITGLTAAVLLARAGRSVAVLEGRHLGGGTTGRSTAKVSLLQGTRLSSLAEQHPPAVLASYVEAHREGQAWLVRFCETHGVGVQERAAVTYARGQQGARSAHRELALAREHGLDATWQQDLDLPFPTSGGARLEGQAQVDPVEVVEALAAEAASRGVVLLEGTRVQRVAGRDPVRVSTSAGRIDAGAVVVATGMPILDRGGYFGRMVPARSYTIALATREPVVDAMYLSAEGGPSSRSLRDAVHPEHGPVVLVGGAGHTTGRDRPATRLAQLRDWSARAFPDAEELAAWSAQDYVPSRGLPFAGPVLPGSPHVQVAGGFAKWGMTGGVAAALAVTARLTGGRVDWADVMDPWSARELRAAGSLVSDNAGVALELARGVVRTVRPGLEGLAGLAARGDDGGHVGLASSRPIARATDDEGSTVSSICTHLGGIVAWNDVERSWDCPLHGSRFGPGGDVLEGPATCGLRRGPSARG
ncbi:FAD-dependent oxidoreductase [Nocardioides sp. CFH 31398]|uniref:FAD-dependent oxidoreductase n=1 Tax=Nocardioides sp. CFH 31398 TaxID=2919579 RepID=UPI001F065467|nr:FAD-dependent oxidoreductase [Nocardioides sp. CFH 31398]MCH1868734.1 FAD-dependent oxidoreductase [Nocardioides sp. CFH 31398]